jgi:hypothetical protein
MERRSTEIAMMTQHGLVFVRLDGRANKRYPETASTGLSPRNASDAHYSAKCTKRTPPRALRRYDDDGTARSCLMYYRTALLQREKDESRRSIHPSTVGALRLIHSVQGEYDGRSCYAGTGQVQQP